MSESAGENIRLSREEFERLSAIAHRDLRHPRDQARYLLRLALGLNANEPIRELCGGAEQPAPEAVHAIDK
jgi:hypothetical protein